MDGRQVQVNGWAGFYPHGTPAFVDLGPILRGVDHRIFHGPTLAKHRRVWVVKAVA